MCTLIPSSPILILTYPHLTYPLLSSPTLPYPTHTILTSCPILPYPHLPSYPHLYSQEATAIGAIWLDVFSSDPTERTDGAGLTRLSDSFSFISDKDMARQTLQVSSIASFLHDDPALFRNDRLADDI